MRSASAVLGGLVTGNLLFVYMGWGSSWEAAIDRSLFQAVAIFIHYSVSRKG